MVSLLFFIHTYISHIHIICIFMRMHGMQMRQIISNDVSPCSSCFQSVPLLVIELAKTGPHQNKKCYQRLLALDLALRLLE